VAVVTDGSAVLGLGNVGPYAALPVMEGKAALFKRFAGIDAWPVCLDTQDPDASDVIICDDRGAVHQGRPGLTDSLRWVAERTNAGGYDGDLAGAVRGADVFIGVSAPNILTGDDVAAMAADAIVFALANPVPEVNPDAAGEHATVVATGRSDYPNQINNVLAFPGVFRGLLDAQSRAITDDMLVAAARALAGVVSPAELGPHYIIPSVFHPDVTPAVAAAVRDAAGGRPSAS
jgi:malate dehydrogenase (oxaloacetate-decarboxylating)